MYPEFYVDDYINLPNYKIYSKFMIGGKPNRPFSAVSERGCKSVVNLMLIFL